jgi:precorrin-3B C17-methyltransferase
MNTNYSSLFIDSNICKVNTIYVVGIGPGNLEHMSIKALKIINNTQVIVGYKTYINLIKDLIVNQEVIGNGMRGEKQRCYEALVKAKKGKSVTIISSGDSGVYAMAGLMLEIISKEDIDIKVEVIPGITSANGAASSLGAPIMHDHVYISLSDLLTDWELIKKRVKLACEGDFVICIFNPKSKGRPNHINEVRDIMLKYKNENTLVGIVNKAKREDENIVITNLKNMLDHNIDMTTMIIIGNSNTYTFKNYMITPRGYQL